MESLYLLIPISVFLVFLIGLIFWWSLRSGQYDDMEGPAYRLLMDDRDELPAGKASDAVPTVQGAPDSAAEEGRGGAKD